LGIEPGRSYIEYSFRALLSVPEVIEDMRCPIISSGCWSTIISEKYKISTLVFTDGSKSVDETGFGVYVPGVRQVGYRLHEPSIVFTAEMSALLDTLLFIKSSLTGEYLILSDNLRSIETLRTQKISAWTYSVIYECRKVLWWLRSKQFKVRLMWIPTHTGIPGNEMVDGIAKDGAKKSALILQCFTGLRFLPAN
jgi:ribonuclease HI